MSDLIVVQQHGFPWAPADDAEMVREYDRWNVPTVGVLKQHDALHMFWCAAGEGSDSSLWAYVHVTPEEVAQLDGSDGDDFEKAFDSLVLGRDVLVVLAADRSGILVQATLPAMGSTRELTLEALSAIEAVLKDSSASVGAIKEAVLA